MREEYLKIYEELEKDGSYELAMSKMLNEIVVNNKKIDEVDKKFKEFEDNYNNYLDMLDSLGIDDEKLELIESLLEKINKYNFIKELIKEVKHNEEIVKQTSNFVLKKNKHTILMMTKLPPNRKAIRKWLFSFRKKAHNKGPVKLESPIKNPQIP